MTPREERDRTREGPPQKFGDTTPPSPQPDYSAFTVQTVLEMQRTLGSVEKAIAHLEDKSKDYGQKLETIGKDLHAAKIVGAFIVLVAGFLGFVIHELIPILSNLKH
jgi:hypothetical protein